MRTKKYALKLEEVHHDKNATFYSLRRKGDYIWEVPEELFLLRKKYFHNASVIVDMGCGPAISVMSILGKNIINNINYIGVDISKRMLEIAKRNIPTGSFIHADIEKPMIPESYADVIISLGCLHHSLNKKRTLKNWFKILKSKGYLLMREPTYDALKRGQGESPMEEGLRPHEIIQYLKKNRFKVISVTFFSSKAFHLFNRILIAFGFGSWQGIRLLWYPVVLIDVVLVKLLSKRLKFFDGLAFTLIAQKI